MTSPIFNISSTFFGNLDLPILPYGLAHFKVRQDKSDLSPELNSISAELSKFKSVTMAGLRTASSLYLLIESCIFSGQFSNGNEVFKFAISI